ncbi:Protein LSM14 -like protein B [Echinococcus granulosus]|uniref:Lsm14b protein n=1 Tax=Echinococcus granulosus TaxID=6210 RepID=U6J927_ECHGR|nr:hypothetical protein EGR_04338 [Echinococcus granulosus]EUB60712.1 hypothetical protein EGR_04338 [Echinococcus granulosus]KAH9281831.1 Protein LSM14 -like protein B [Echinococcus granulosus]CDS18931.1 Lsm14b protein [Echinococcus granulosus]
MSLLEFSLVGHRIRIISKAQIRYEGTLFSIRKDENNDLVLVLSKVTSYGTEDRPCEHPVKPLSEVYEHIAFRGRELVDLQLLPTPRVGDDPSIISAELEPGPLSKSEPQGSGDAPSTSNFFSQPESSSISSFPNFMTPKPPADLLADIPATPWGNLGALGAAENDQSTGAAVGATVTPSNEDSESKDTSKNVPMSVQNGEGRRDTQNRSSGRGFRPNYSNYQRYGGRNDGGHGENRPRGASSANQYSNSRRGYNQRQRHYDHVNKQRSEDVNFKEDYDFDKPNAELAEFLEKVEISPHGNTEPEHGEEAAHENSDTYDSSKSFFDTLSSELMDRAHGVVNSRSHREDRKQNFDTFGPAANRIGAAFRGGYRGRRGSGVHYRGNQRGGYKYSNKQNAIRKVEDGGLSNPKQLQQQQQQR